MVNLNENQIHPICSFQEHSHLWLKVSYSWNGITFHWIACKELNLSIVTYIESRVLRHYWKVSLTRRSVVFNEAYIYILIARLAKYLLYHLAVKTWTWTSVNNDKWNSNYLIFIMRRFLLQKISKIFILDCISRISTTYDFYDFCTPLYIKNFYYKRFLRFFYSTLSWWFLLLKEFHGSILEQFFLFEKCWKPILLGKMWYC